MVCCASLESSRRLIWHILLCWSWIPIVGDNISLEELEMAKMLHQFYKGFSLLYSKFSHFGNPSLSHESMRGCGSLNSHPAAYVKFEQIQTFRELE